MPLSFADFSKCADILSKATSILPDASPAATMLTMMSGKTFGYFFRPSERVSPFWISAWTPLIAFAMTLFSVWSDSISSVSRIVTPALTILVNWRQNTDRSLGFTFPPTLNEISLVSAVALVRLMTMFPSILSLFFASASDSATIFPFLSFPLWSIIWYVQSATFFSSLCLFCATSR